MKYGLSVPNVGPTAELLRLTTTAEASGWDGVFLWDHLHLRRALRLEVVDPWVMIGAQAVVTERVRLGALVTPLSRRRPWKMAKEVVTADHLSDGRLVVGVGLGEPPQDDFAAFGDASDPKERASRLDDGLAVLAGLLITAVTGEPFTYEGPHYRVDAAFLPPPVQRPRPPIWVAGVVPHRKPFERARQWDGVVPLAPDDLMRPDQVAAVLAITGTRPDFDVVVSPDPAVPLDEFADSGATWLIYSAAPWIDGWKEDLARMAADGPPR